MPVVDKSLVGGFLFGPPEAGSKVGTASRPDTIWRVVARRGSVVARVDGPLGARGLLHDLTSGAMAVMCPAF